MAVFFFYYFVHLFGTGLGQLVGVVWISCVVGLVVLIWFGSRMWFWLVGLADVGWWMVRWTVYHR